MTDSQSSHAQNLTPAALGDKHRDILLDSKFLLLAAVWLVACGEPSNTNGDGQAQSTSVTNTNTNTNGTSTTGSGTSSSSTTTGGMGGTGGGGTSSTSTSTGIAPIPSAPCSGGTQACDASVVAADAAQPAAFSVVPPYLYWRESSRLRRLKLDPLGEPETLVQVEGVSSVAADATHIYFVMGNEMFRAPAAGGTPEQLLMLTRDLYDVEVDDSTVYFTDFEGLYSAPKQGGAVTPLFVGPSRTLELHGDHVYLVVEEALLEDGSEVTGVVRLPRSGGMAEAVYQGEAPLIIHPSDQGVAIATRTQILFQPLGGALVPLLNCSGDCGSLVVDGNQVFVTDNTGPLGAGDYPADVYAVPVTGGTPSLLGHTASQLLSIKYYGDRLYFSHYAEAGSILSLGKCPCQ